jgi:hypothetical protein
MVDEFKAIFLDENLFADNTGALLGWQVCTTSIQDALVNI